MQLRAKDMYYHGNPGKCPTKSEKYDASYFYGSQCNSAHLGDAVSPTGIRSSVGLKQWKIPTEFPGSSQYWLCVHVCLCRWGGAHLCVWVFHPHRIQTNYLWSRYIQVYWVLYLLLLLRLLLLLLLLKLGHSVQLINFYPYYKQYTQKHYEILMWPLLCVYVCNRE